MKVFVAPSDDNGCGRYRMRYPAEALMAKGYKVTVGKLPRLLNVGNKIVGTETSFNYDVVVIQRPARPQYLQLIEYLQGKGIKVVIDYDDDLTCIHPSNPAFIPYQQPDMHWRFGVEACLMADLVTCATDALAETYGTPTNTIVLPNCVPESFLSLPSNPRKRVPRDPLPDPLMVVGWAGICCTHPADLQVTCGAVNEALSNRLGKACFLALGDEKTLFNLGIRNRAPHGWQKGVPIDQYPEFLSQLDIGIVPLEDSKFNKAKSWLKALEYASLGIVPVVSPTPDNLKMVAAGAALSASAPAEWRDKIRLLIDDHQVRENLSNQAQEFARSMTYERNAERWWDAWSRTLG